MTTSRHAPPWPISYQDRAKHYSLFVISMDWGNPFPPPPRLVWPKPTSTDAPASTPQEATKP